MKIITRFQWIASRLSKPHVTLAMLLCLASAEASARVPVSVPEPSTLTLLGSALVIGIIVHRFRGPKD